MRNSKFISLALAAALMLSLFAGCAGSSPAPASSTAPAPVPAPSSEPAPEPLTEAISFEEGVNAFDDIVKTEAAEKVILVVSFGTSFNQSRALTIGAIEEAFRTAYPDYQVRRAFTAQIIIDKLAERDGLYIDNIEQAMDRLVLDRVKEVVIQPTTVMAGYEYDDVIAAITPYADKFESFRVGKPMLIDDADFNAAADIMLSELAKFEADGTDILLMGHGTHHAANATYPRLEGLFRDKGHDDIYIGTVEGGVLIEDLLPVLKEKGTKKVVLRPFMIVAGDHANNDMAGSEPDSWKSILEAEGYEVECVMEGLGEVPAMRDIFLRHTTDALDSKGVQLVPAAASAAAEPAGIGGGWIKDGTYAIKVSSDKSMFKIVDCQLTVKDGEMSAVITLSATGYGKLYMGVSSGADADPESQSEFTLNGERHSFTVPVNALDVELDCAGFSIRRQQWYDYKVVFESGEIPPEAFETKQIDVTMSGGSGRASVESPAGLTRENGAYLAEITWSSPNYIYMTVDGTKFNPVNTDGNSVFKIPVDLDSDMKVIGCTVAMGSEKEIEYTLRFDSSTIK